MPVISTIPTSRRGYLSYKELEQFANIVVTNVAEATDQISQAEELIDAYVGFIKKWFGHYPITGLASAGSTTTLTLESGQQNVYEADYFKGMEVEILGGTGEGERKKVSSSTKAGVLTTETFTATLDTTSYYKIYQLGKFPREIDVHCDTSHTPIRYYKSIPEAVKRATASEVEFIIKMGQAYFQTDKATMESESIGDYSYSKSPGSGGSIETLIAPKVKVLLRGIVNRTGTMIVS